MAIEHGGNIFAVAREHGWDWREVLDFSASINPLGAAPGVQRAICEAAERIVHYPELGSPELCAELARTWSVEPDQIIAGNGATELIFFLARVLGRRPVTLAMPFFSEFERAFPEAPHVALDEPGTWPREGVLVLTRPANPTGRTLPLHVLESWLAATSGMAIVDESFIDFSDAPSAASLIDTYPNVIVLRSLTKFYALPGLRVGAMISAMPGLRERREPWQVNVLAEAAAIAALRDTEHAATSKDFVRRERAWLTRELGVPEGDANFIHIPLGRSAKPLCEFLLREQILIRNCGDSVRIAVRPHEENKRLVNAWRAFECA